MKSGVYVLQEHEGFGGSSFDTRKLSDFFNYDKPHNFGKMVSKIFTSSSRFTTKILTGMTYAQGNFYAIDNDIYRWALTGDDERLFRVVEFVEVGNARPGYAQASFQIVLDKGWLREPDVLLCENNNYMIRIIGDPQMTGEGTWLYTCKVQGSDPTLYIPTDQIDVGMTFKKATTQVGTNMNQKYGTGQWGAQLELQSQIGAYAEEFKVDDKLIRKELQARRRNGSVARGRTKDGNGYTGYGAMSGYMAPISVSAGGKTVESGAFISYAEADLLERIEMGRELMMVFGKFSETMDNVGRSVMRTGPGFRELVRDGHTYYHNGAITADQMEDFFMQIFLYRKNEAERDIVVDTGTLGARIFDQLLQDEASAFLTVDTNYIRQMEGGANWELEYGAQFKSFRAKNGIRVRLVMNPMKDDPNLCRRMHPDNPIYTVDSARMDIYDFGSSMDSVAPNKSNISMIMENDIDEYYWIAPLVDPYSGMPTDGRKVASGQKGVTCRRAASGSLCVWDTSRIGSIIYEPDL